MVRGGDDLSVLYEPSAKQQEFHACPADEVLFAGAAGPGKTVALVADILPRIQIEHDRCVNRAKWGEHGLHWGGSRGWSIHLRRSAKDLQQTIQYATDFYKAVDPGCEWVPKQEFFRFSSGYRAQFGHCFELNDWNKYIGNAYDYIAFDELVQFTEEQYQKITFRLRSSDPILGRRDVLKIRACSNPMTARTANDNWSIHDPHWVRRLFVDPAPGGNVLLKQKVRKSDGSIAYVTRMYIPARLIDNPNKQFVDTYDLQLSKLPVALRKAYRDGDWYITAGSFFAEAWDPDIHVCKPFNIPSYWPQWRSMDWGHKKPGCVHWYAMDEDDNEFVTRELTFQGKDADWVADRVKQIEIENGQWDKNRGCSRLNGPADPQLWERRGDVGKSKAASFSAKGINWVPAEKTNHTRARHAERITERLNDHGGGSKTPGLVIFDTCTMLIRTLPAIQTDPTDPESPADGGDDHWLDCVFGETLVTTERGAVPISALTSDDRVLSTDGGFWPCTGGRTVRKAMLYRVRMEGAEDLLATGNHLILCSDQQWRRVDELDSSCYAISPWILWSHTRALPSLSLRWRASARSAREALKAITARSPSSAQELAKQRLEDFPESMTRNAFALPVGVRSWSAGSRVGSTVLGGAHRILDVSPEREEMTWCTTVPIMGAFVASGIIVSNSLGYGTTYASHGRSGLGKPIADDEDDDGEPEDRDRGQYGYGGF